MSSIWIALPCGSAVITFFFFNKPYFSYSAFGVPRRKVHFSFLHEFSIIGIWRCQKRMKNIIVIFFCVVCALSQCYLPPIPHLEKVGWEYDSDPPPPCLWSLPDGTLPNERDFPTLLDGYREMHFKTHTRQHTHAHIHPPIHFLGRYPRGL